MKKILTSLLTLALLSMGSTIFAQPITNKDYAIAQFEDLVKQNKNDKGVYLSLCLMYSEAGQYNKMLNLMRKMLHTFKGDTSIVEVLNDYAREYINKKNYSLSQKILDLYLKKFKHDENTTALYSETLLHQGKVNENISFLKAYLKKNPTTYFLQDKLIDSYLINGDYEKAFERASETLNLNLGNIYYYFLLGLAKQPQSKQEAITYYKAYLDKLGFTNDIKTREGFVKKIYAVLKYPSSNAEDYKSLIKNLEKLNAPTSHIIIQAKYASKLYPADPYFSNKITESYNKLGVIPILDK